MPLKLGTNTINLPYSKAYLGDVLKYQKKDKPTYLEYIESTGTQYIDTGVNADNNLSIIIDMQMTVSGANNFGAITQTSSISYVRHHCTTTNSGLNYWHSNFNEIVNSKESKNLERHIYNFDIYNNQIIVDGGTPQSISHSNFDLALNYRLFGRNSNVLDLQSNANMKMYSCQMYYKDVLVRDFKPAVDKNNVICLYDEVDKKYYYNLGTGMFLGR